MRTQIFNFTILAAAIMLSCAAQAEINVLDPNANRVYFASAETGPVFASAYLTLQNGVCLINTTSALTSLKSDPAFNPQVNLTSGQKQELNEKFAAFIGDDRVKSRQISFSVLMPDGRQNQPSNFTYVNLDTSGRDQFAVFLSTLCPRK